MTQRNTVNAKLKYDLYQKIILSISMSQTNMHPQPALSVCLNTEGPQMSTCILLSSPSSKSLPFSSRQWVFPPDNTLSSNHSLLSGGYTGFLSSVNSPCFSKEDLIAGFHIFKENV